MRTLLRLWRLFEVCPWDRAVLADWQERFALDFALIRPHLRPTDALATAYPCPSGSGDGCPRRIYKRNGEFVAVCGNVPAECEPKPLRKTDLAVLALDREAVLGPVVARVCAQESLVTTNIEERFEGLLPLGILGRHVGRVLVVLATAQASAQRGAILELRRSAGTDAVAVLVDRRRETRLIGDGYVELGIETPDDLWLWRALRVLWPESWSARASRKEAVFEEVHLEFGAEDTMHIVRLNGELLRDFRLSDTKFARLLRLAASRWVDQNVEDGGWLKKIPHLQLDECEIDLVELRAAFIGDRPDGFAGLTAAERKALVQSSKDRPGLVRLAINPRHLRFDPSLRNVRLLGDQQSEPRTRANTKRKTSGSDDLARNKGQARAKALKMLGEARKLGVPLPEESVLRSRRTET